jgi:lipopolysaccharide export system permease protein
MINRMILTELVKVSLMCLISLTGLFVLAGLIQDASRNGLSPSQLLMAIPLIIPNMLPFTIPASTLFATCVVYSRMSADNEILVLRAAGVNIYRLLAPAIVLGLVASAFTAAMEYDPIPRTQRKLREQIVDHAEEFLYSILKREGGLRKPDLDFVLYVREVQGKDLIDVIVKKRNADRTGFELVARAPTATLRVQRIRGATSEDSLQKGSSTSEGEERIEIVINMSRCYIDYLKGETSAEVQEKDFTTSLPESLFGKDSKDRPSTQTWEEMIDRRREVVELLNKYTTQMNEYAAKGDAPSPTAGKTYAEEATALKNGYVYHYKRLVRIIDSEKSMRPALALGCLCFVLIGCPVGIWANRSDYLSVFIICFLPVAFVYYPILMATSKMAKDGKAQPEVIWIANAIAFVAGLILIKKLMKR